MKSRCHKTDVYILFSENAGHWHCVHCGFPCGIIKQIETQEPDLENNNKEQFHA